MTYTVPIMSAHFSLSASYGESSETPNPPNNTSSPNSSVKVESPDYSHFASANPPFTTINEHRVLAIAPLIKVEVPSGKGKGKELELPAPHTEEELIEIARLANALLRKAAADLVPHVHYPFTDNKDNAKSSSPDENSPLQRHKRHNHKDRKNRKNDNAHNRLSSSQRPHPLAHLKIFTRSYHCPTTIIPRAPGDNRPLIKFYSKSYFDAQIGHFAAPGPKSESKPELKSRKRLFYVKKFLAGPDAKTEARGQRVFYQRRLVWGEGEL